MWQVRIILDADASRNKIYENVFVDLPSNALEP